MRTTGTRRSLFLRALRGLALGIAALALAVALYLGAAVVGALVPGRSAAAEPGGGGTVRIGLIASPIHFDLLLPLTPTTREGFAFAAAAGVPLSHPEAVWLVAGWGSAAFYTTTAQLSDISAATTLRAATGDAAVLRLDVAGALPPGLPVTWLALSPGQAKALSAAIAAEATGPALPIPGFTDTDAFFPAQGRFHLIRTCNVWVGERLRAAGLRFGAWTPTPQAVRLSLWWFGHAGAPRPG